MAKGAPGTATRASTFFDATSMIATSFEDEFAVKSFLPSGLTAMPRGNAPTPSMVPTTVFYSTSTMSTDFPAPVVR